MYLGTRNSRRLPPSERQVIALICAGLTYKEMATELGLPFGTIKNRIISINQHVGTHSMAQIVAEVARQVPGAFRDGGPSADDLMLLRTTGDTEE
jgi:DNA-binding NarL/FixJ family response regulator